tara:strand:- start:53 stop:688 length:636 start_codon:yes stop_codon:yes gene_type:complete
MYKVLKNKLIRKKLLSEKKSDKKLIGYARAIDNEIDYLNKQIYDLHNAGCNSIFSEIISASVENKPELQNAFNALTPGDILIIDRLDRPFYSKNDCIKGLNILLQRGIDLKILSSNFSSSERYKPFNLILKVLLELENLDKYISEEKKREMHKNRNIIGLNLGGRPKMSKIKESLVLRLRSEGYSYRTIRSQTGVALSTIRRIILDSEGNN